MSEIIALVQSNNPNETRSLRSAAGIIYNKIGTVAPDTVCNAAYKIVATFNGEFGTDSLAGDIWWKVEGVRIKEDNTPRNGWLAEKHKGVTYLAVTLITEEPLPVPAIFPDSFTLTAPDGSTAEYTKI